jgi:DNA-binding Lrp family transcriptional regulator
MIGIRPEFRVGKGATVDGTTTLDAVDRRLIEVLMDDGRCSVNELARRAGVGRATAYQRLGRLRDQGVIEGFTVRVDPRAMGLRISALVLVNVEQRAWRDVRPRLLALPGAEWLGATAGEFDFALLVRAPDVETMRDVVLERLQFIPGVKASETVLLLDDHWIPHSVPGDEG